MADRNKMLLGLAFIGVGLPLAASLLGVDVAFSAIIAGIGGILLVFLGATMAFGRK